MPERCALVVLILCLSVVGCVKADDPDWITLEKRLGEVVDRAYLGQFWGAVVVRVGGRDVFRHGYGFDGPSLMGIDPGESLFDVGSVAKSLTAAAIMRMIDDGELAMETQLSGVFDGGAGNFSDTTIGELLGHRWGLRDGSSAFQNADMSDRMGLLTAVRRMRSDTPRGSFAYSNVGYFILAAVIEEKSGEPFEVAVRNRVLLPAGLKSTGFVGEGPIEGTRSTVRASQQQGNRRTSDLFEYPWNWAQRGATGIVMTPDNAARWVEAAWSGSVMTEASREAMFDPGEGDYGLGWFITTDDLGINRIGHGGSTGGYRSQVAHYPRAMNGLGATIVVTTNEQWDPRDIEYRLSKVISPSQPKPSKAGIYLFRYAVRAGTLELNEGLSWMVMPSYHGTDKEGNRVIDDRPTVVLVDAVHSVWPTMVILDVEDARTLMQSVEAALQRLPKRPRTNQRISNSGLSLRIDVSDLELSDTRHFELAAGSLWHVESEDDRVIARLVDLASNRTLATVSMDATEAESFAASLREVVDQ